MATLTAKDVGHVEKLSGTNFPFWKFQISFVLRQHGLMDIVLGKETCPVPDIDNDIVKNAPVYWGPSITLIQLRSM